MQKKYIYNHRKKINCNREINIERKDFYRKSKRKVKDLIKLKKNLDVSEQSDLILWKVDERTIHNDASLEDSS